MLEIAILIITLIFLLYIAAIYHNGYWKRRNIPGPESKPFIGNANDWISETSTPMKLKKWTEIYGKVYGVQLGRSNILVISDSEMINELFVSKFDYFHERRFTPLGGNVDTQTRVHMFSARGARWKRLRSLSSPAFSISNLKKILPLICDSAFNLVNHMDKAYDQNLTIDLDRYFHEYSLDIIMRIALGQSESLIFKNNYFESFDSLFKNLDKETIKELHAYTLPKSMRNLYLVYNSLKGLIWDDSIKNFENRIGEIVKKRKMKRLNNEDDELELTDFIDFFLNCESQEEIKLNNDESNFEQKKTKILKKLTIEEVSAQCFLFLLAGFDTTGSTLQSICFFLVNNPHIQKKLQDEIMEICPNGEPTYEQMNQLKYFDAIIKETLRFSPIAALSASRVCVKDTTLGDYKIEAGTIVHADVLSIHFNKKIWGEDADKFSPDRWLINEDLTKLQANWLPFGAGPRVCVGMKLAYLVIKMALIHILQKYTFVKTEKTKDKFTLEGTQLLKLSSIYVKLKAADNNY